MIFEKICSFAWLHLAWNSSIKENWLMGKKNWNSQCDCQGKELVSKVLGNHLLNFSPAISMTCWNVLAMNDETNTIEFAANCSNVRINGRHNPVVVNAFTFMHLADAFIQSHSGYTFFTPTTFALLTLCSTTEPQEHKYTSSEASLRPSSQAWAFCLWKRPPWKLIRD